MFADLSRAGNILGMNTWSSFARSEHRLKTEDAILGQRGQLLESFINQEYQGIYSFNDTNLFIFHFKRTLLTPPHN